MNVYFSGKSESTLKMGREIRRKLHTDAHIVLGYKIFVIPDIRKGGCQIAGCLLSLYFDFVSAK